MPEGTTFYLAQLNPIVGDIRGNIKKIADAYDCAAKEGVDLVITSELVVSGYPPEDLVARPEFLDMVEAHIQELAVRTGKTGLLLGTPWRQSGKLYNAALLLSEGEIKATTLKQHLPNYGVFDEQRLFAAAGPQPPMAFRGKSLGVMICEDIWVPGTAKTLADQGADILIVMNGSPYSQKNLQDRHQTVADQAKEADRTIIYVNQIGGQDELVFDGRSFVMTAQGQKALCLKAWAEDACTYLWRENHLPKAAAEQVYDLNEDTYNAVVLGLRDYVEKNHFPGVVIGLSGGIDSALSAILACDALGADRVFCVFMPSRYTSKQSVTDAEQLALNLGCQFEIIPIDETVEQLNKSLAPVFQGTTPDVTEENIQSRLRGLTLMAISNKFGHMVLTTGNKSEMATGYATLYGDMCGGFNALKDLYKVEVFKLSKWRNANVPDISVFAKKDLMPDSIITKPPSAELRPDQKDEDSLPAYDVLDDILARLIEREQHLETIVQETGYDIDLVKKVWKMLVSAEHKRYQAPPGVKVTARAFGKDRRYPLTNAYLKNIA